MQMTPLDIAREEQNKKQREFNTFILTLAISCFEDCVTDFTRPGNQTEQERSCIKNCVNQQLKMHGSLGEVMDELNEKYKAY